VGVVGGVRAGRLLSHEEIIMKFSELTFQPRLLRKEDAEQYVGGRRNLEALRQWVKPVVQHHSNTTFDVKDLDAAIDRAKLEGWPA
jgi:hypothetical protein